MTRRFSDFHEEEHVFDIDDFEDFDEEQDEIEDFCMEIDGYYNKIQLDEINSEYLIPWAKAGVFNDAPKILKILSSNPTKEVLQAILANFIMDKETFLNAYKNMIPAVQEAFYLCVWQGVADIAELYKKHNVKVKNTALGANKLLLDIKFRFFKTDYNFQGEQKGEIELHPLIRSYLKKHLSKPSEAQLHSLPEDKIKTQFRGNYEDEILENIYVIMEMKRSGEIEYGGNLTVTKTVIKNFLKNVKIKEMFETHLVEEAKHIKEEMMLKVLCSADIEEVNDEDQPEKLLKSFFENFFTGYMFYRGNGYYGKQTFSINLFKMILKHIKLKSYYEEQIVEYLVDIKEQLIEMCDKEWVEVGNIISSSILSELLPITFYEDDAYSILRDNDLVSYGKRNQSDQLILDKLILPFTKGMMALFSFWGIVEIAYDDFKVKNQSTFFDGVKYVKVTELGKYILGKNPNYEPKSRSLSDIAIELDNSGLKIKVTGEDKLKRMIIEKISKEKRENTFEVNYDTVFQGCEGIENVLAKINRFKGIVGDLPKVWEDFFDKIVNNFSSAEELQNLTVFKIKEDKELIDIIAKDSELKKMILKAEKYHILFETKDKSKIIKIFKSYGYFL